MPRVVILGAGMIGSTMAADMARDAAIDVTIVDVGEHRLARVAASVGRLTGRTIATIRADLTVESEVAQVVDGADVVLGALPSGMGLQTLRRVVEAGRHYVDISFMPENPLILDGLAASQGVVAIVDCGVAPGLSNLLAGWATRRLATVDVIEILVGGLPVERRWPFQYKAAFSPADVIEEYTRPARLVENGRVVTRPALSEPELVDFDGVGTLEAFNTDGLRTLIETLGVPTMREKTLRYPGHVELMRVLREAGYFSSSPITVGNVQVRPLDLTSTLLFPLWTYEEGEADLTVMRVRASGDDGRGGLMRLEWTLHDRFCHTTGQTSMSRTTAFPATIMARAILDGRIARRGVLPPERLVDDDGLVRHVLGELADRGVTVVESMSSVE